MTPDSTDFQVDESALDREWVAQPARYFRYAELLAAAKLEHARLENELKVAEAEVSVDIRNNPDAYGIKPYRDSVKEGDVEIRVKLHKRVQAAVKAVNQAQHEIDVLNAACRALDHKKAALENLVSLHGQNYFSTPRERQAANETENWTYSRDAMKHKASKAVIDRVKKKLNKN